MVVGDRLQEHLSAYVKKLTPFLEEQAGSNKLFRTSKVSNDIAAVNAMFGLRTLNPTMMRKAMGSTAYVSVSDVQWKQIANHMTHRPETAHNTPPKTAAAKLMKACL